MAPTKTVLFIEFGIAGSVVWANKISLCARLIQTATDNLFYLALMKVYAGVEIRSKGGSHSD